MIYELAALLARIGRVLQRDRAPVFLGEIPINPEKKFSVRNEDRFASLTKLCDVRDNCELFRARTDGGTG